MAKEETNPTDTGTGVAKAREMPPKPLPKTKKETKEPVALLDMSVVLAKARAVVPPPQLKSRYIITYAGQPFSFRRRAGAVGFVAGLVAVGEEVEKAERVGASE